MKISEVKFRCSSLGKILTEERGSVITEKQLARLNELVEKSLTKALPPGQGKELDELIAKRDAPISLGATCVTYLHELYINLRFGRKKDITTRAIDKGLKVEEDSFTLYSLLKKKAFFKNEKHYNEDPDIMGTPDEVNDQDDDVKDIKSSWSIFTFFATMLTKLKAMYFWQLQGYMILTRRKKAKLVYCLTDTPEQMLNDEKWWLARKMGVIDSLMDDDYIKACEEIDRLGIYTDIPLEERIHEIEIPFEESAETKIRARVKECRIYMLETWPKFFVNDLNLPVNAKGEEVEAA